MIVRLIVLPLLLLRMFTITSARTRYSTLAFYFAMRVRAQSTTTACKAISDDMLERHNLSNQSVESTQDVVKEMLSDNNNNNSRKAQYLAVWAHYQSKGRGTRGRTWQGAADKQNLYLTIGLPMSKIPSTITLLPLQVGVVVAETIKAALKKFQCNCNNAVVSVKWPNDVLINKDKIAGILIENTVDASGTTYFLVGIGVNVMVAPDLVGTPGKHGRVATSIQSVCNNGNTDIPVSLIDDMANNITTSLVEWMENAGDKATIDELVISQWKALANFGQEYEIRGSVDQESAGAYNGERVVSLDVQSDGQLKVRGSDGRERLLIADYLF